MIDREPGVRPRQTLGRQLDVVARWGFPASSTAVMLLVASAPIGLPGHAELQGAIALACIYFWSLFRPAAMPPGVVFLIGLLVDLLGYAPPGVAVLTLLMVHGLAMAWRRVLVRQGFLMVWLAFVAVACAAAALSWALTCLLTFHLLPPVPGIFQAVFAAGLYPPLATWLTRAHHSLAAPERA